MRKILIYKSILRHEKNAIQRKQYKLEFTKITKTLCLWKCKKIYPQHIHLEKQG